MIFRRGRGAEHPWDDPTGMRALLSSLPDPGPVPEDVAHRLRARLAEELDGEQVAWADADIPVIDEDRRHRHRRTAVALAAAAAVLVVTGGLAVLVMGPGIQVAAVHAGRGAASTPGTQRPGDATGDGVATPSSAPGSGTGPQAGAVLGGDTVLVVATGHRYDADHLAVQAALLIDLPSPSGAGTATPLGHLATASGVRGCARAIGIPSTARVMVDLADVDGRPAAVVVAQGRGEVTAYAVERTCRPGAPGLILGPVAVP